MLAGWLALFHAIVCAGGEGGGVLILSSSSSASSAASPRFRLVITGIEFWLYECGGGGARNQLACLPALLACSSGAEQSRAA